MRRTTRVAFCLIAAVWAAGTAWAQSYPTKPVRLVVGFPPGGATDVVARLVSQRMSEALGQAVIVENRAGAASNIGAELVATAPKDGHTLLMGTVSLSINRSLYSKLAYDALRDFAAITQVTSTPFMFDNIVTTLPLARAGRLRALAVTTGTRSSAAPDIPTVAEAGVPGYDANAWFGVFAPSGTPPAVVNRLHSEIVKIVKLPDVRDRLLSLGGEPVGSTPGEFAAFFRNEVAKWGGVVKVSGARAD